MLTTTWAMRLGRHRWHSDASFLVRLARVLDADDLAHLQHRRLVVELFGHGLANRLHRQLAATAHPLSLWQLDHGAHARQVAALPTNTASARRLLFALVLFVGSFADMRRGRHWRCFFDCKGQLALTRLVDEALAAAAVDHVAELRDEQLQLLIGLEQLGLLLPLLREICGEFTDARSQLHRVIAKDFARRCHMRLYARNTAPRFSLSRSSRIPTPLFCVLQIDATQHHRELG